MAELKLNLGENLALYKGHPSELIEQDINAQVMAPEAMERLTENIRKDKRLEQFPFAVLRDDGRHELISGHHRKRAALAAELPYIYWLADTRTDMARSTVVAKQLAHNSLRGEPDKETVKVLYAELDTVEALLESYVTPADFDSVDQLEKSDATTLGLTIDWKSITLVFTPEVMESLERIEDYVTRTIPDDTAMVGVIPVDLLARFRQAALNVAKIEDVRSLGSVFARMCEIVEAHIAAEEKPDAAEA